jgi:hypothetical protein
MPNGDKKPKKSGFITKLTSFSMHSDCFYHENLRKKHRPAAFFSTLSIIYSEKTLLIIKYGY